MDRSCKGFQFLLNRDPMGVDDGLVNPRPNITNTTPIAPVYQQAKRHRICWKS